MVAADIVPTLLSAVGSHLDIFGALGLALGFAAGMMPRRSLILCVSAACAATFGLHYWHIGAVTGMAMCSISVVQSLVSARFIGPGSRRAWVVPVFGASSLVAASLTLATWSGWASACAGVGALLASAARLQADAQTMRRLFVAASLCWAAHNLLVGSVFGLTCDLLTISGLVVALRRRAGRTGAGPLRAKAADTGGREVAASCPVAA
nr:YgjV family protein [Methylobacterium segetis]